MGDQFILTGSGRYQAEKNLDEQQAQVVYGTKLDSWKDEIAGYFGVMQKLIDMDAIAAFQHLSQFSARASEIRSQLGTQESRREAAFRIRIIDPFIEECDRQFKIHSRIQAIREMDARLAGGSFA